MTDVAMVQITLPAPATDLVAKSLRASIGTLYVESDDEETVEPALQAVVRQLEMLAEFFEDVAQNPTYYRVTGRMAKSLRARGKTLRGPAQPQAKRKAKRSRHGRRIDEAKARRQDIIIDGVPVGAAGAYNELRQQFEDAGLPIHGPVIQGVLDGEFTFEQVQAEVAAQVAQGAEWVANQEAPPKIVLPAGVQIPNPLD